MRSGRAGAAGELPNGAGALARILARDAATAMSVAVRMGGGARALLGLPLPERRK